MCYNSPEGDPLEAEIAALRAEVASMRNTIEVTIRMMSGDPDGTINWATISEVLTSYASRFTEGEDAIAEVERLKSAQPVADDKPVRREGESEPDDVLRRAVHAGGVRGNVRDGGEGGGA